MDFLQVGRQIGAGVRPSQSQKRGLAYRPRCLLRPGRKSFYCRSHAPSGAKAVAKIAGGAPGVCLRCRVRKNKILKLREEFAAADLRFHGLVHSIAFCRLRPHLRTRTIRRRFHENTEAVRSCVRVDISCLLADRNLQTRSKPCSIPTGSVVGHFSIFDDPKWQARIMATWRRSRRAPRFVARIPGEIVSAASSRESASNAGRPGAPKKTSASAGIPGYVDAYLYAEQATLRQTSARSRTEEVARNGGFSFSAQPQAASTPNRSSSMQECP